MKQHITKLIVKYLKWRQDRLSTTVTLPTSGTTTITREMEKAIKETLEK